MERLSPGEIRWGHKEPLVGLVHTLTHLHLNTCSHSYLHLYTHSHVHTHIHTHTHTLTLALIFIVTLSLILTQSCSYSHTHTHSHSYSHSNTLTHIHSHMHSLSHTHTHTCLHTSFVSKKILLSYCSSLTDTALAYWIVWMQGFFRRTKLKSLLASWSSWWNRNWLICKI